MTQNKKLDKFENLKKSDRKKILKDSGFTDDGAEFEATRNETLSLCWHKQQKIIEAALKDNIDIGEDSYTDTETDKKMYKDPEDGKIKEDTRPPKEEPIEEPKEKKKKVDIPEDIPEIPTIPVNPTNRTVSISEDFNISDR